MKYDFRDIIDNLGAIVLNPTPNNYTPVTMREELLKRLLLAYFEDYAETAMIPKNSTLRIAKLKVSPEFPHEKSKVTFQWKWMTHNHSVVNIPVSNNITFTMIKSFGGDAGSNLEIYKEYVKTTYENPLTN